MWRTVRLFRGIEVFDSVEGLIKAPASPSGQEKADATTETRRGGATRGVAESVRRNRKTAG